MAKNTSKPTGVAVGRVLNPPSPGPEHRRLDMFIGKWINEGQTVATPGAPSVRKVTSDVYAR